MSSAGPVSGNGASAKQPSCTVHLAGEHKSGWRRWREENPTLVVFILFLIASCIIVVAVVPPVCVLRGCGAGGKGQAKGNSNEQINRLIVTFENVSTTVKSRIPAWMYEYIQEKALSSGIKIVSFDNSEWLDKIRKILEQQKDLRILLRDSAQSNPVRNPWRLRDAGLNLTTQITFNATSPASRRRSAQQQQQQQQQVVGEKGSPPLPQQTQQASLRLGDELADKQWANIKVQAPQAWNLSEGANVVIAVIDTGCDIDHPDLKEHLWVNPLEIPNNGKDDDNNGYVDDVHGYDFAGPCANDFVVSRNITNINNCGSRPDPRDIDSHGTHCTGIVAAVRNNRVGIAGIAPNASIMCLKVVPNDGVFYLAHILSAIDYAVQNGAHIISCSFGPAKPNLKPSALERSEMKNQTDLYYKQLEKVAAKNMLLVAAAGNENTDLDSVIDAGGVYNPCTMARDFPDNVLCVMATTDDDKRLFEKVSNQDVGTNYGSRTVDIGAPGDRILSTVPALDKTSQQLWAYKTGSSMATPLVAGIGALVMSILGTQSGNFYKGKEARQILISSANTSVGLPNIHNGRVNAVTAVEQAYDKLTGIVGPVLQGGFSEAAQSVLTAGFNETYYRGAPPVDSIQWRDADILEASTRATTDSRFEAYKCGNGTTLFVRASMNLSQPGLYLMRVNTTAAPEDLSITIGQVKIQNISAVQLIKSTGGWYVFEMRYRNPTAVVDITLAAPNAGGEPKLGYLPVFFVSTPIPPRDYYYAPSMALSSAFQVLTRPSANASVGTSILPGVLDINQPFNYSAVVEDLNFTAPTALADALFPSSNRPRAVVGIAHTRLRAPAVPMRFMVSCSRCALYINTLRILDVYDPSGRGGVVTQLSNCISFGPGGAAATSDAPGTAAGTAGAAVTAHDLTLRFGVNSTAYAPLLLTWLTCDSPDNGDTAVPVTTHTVSNLLWRPDSGVAGYVSGMQCDVWPSSGQSSSPPQTAPLLKFRLPTAVAQTRAYIRGNLTEFDRMYSPMRGTKCSANETASPNCTANAAFIPFDIMTGGKQLGVNVDIRCWTFVNGGLRNGTVEFLFAEDRTVNAYLAGQTVFQSQHPISEYKLVSMAANVTVLRGYHQLLVLEWRNCPFDSLFAVYNGTSAPNGAFLSIDPKRTLLPFPVVSEAVSPGQTNARLASSTAGHHRRRRELARTLETAGAGSELPATSKAIKPGQLLKAGAEFDQESEVAVTAGTAGAPGQGRQLQQQQQTQKALQGISLSGRDYDPIALGASAYTLSQVPASPGLIASVLVPSANYSSRLGLLTQTVLYNTTVVGMSPGELASSTCTSTAGLYGSVCDPPAAGKVTPRYVQIGGFLRVPPSSPGTASGSGGMVPWVIRQREAQDMATSITFGGVTVRNGVEYPSSVNDTETVVYVPRRVVDVYVPAVVTSRSNRSSAQARYDVVLLSGASRAETRVDRSEWFGTGVYN